MSIAAAVAAADATVPPARVLSQSDCLTFRMQAPAPLLYIRAVTSDTALIMDELIEAVAEPLFPEFAAAARKVTAPEVLLEGEMVPLPLVVSRERGQQIADLWLAAASCDVAVLPGVAIGMSRCSYSRGCVPFSLAHPPPYLP